MHEERPYFLCPQCNKLVLVITAMDIGIFCRECGSKCYKPKDKIDFSYDVDEMEESEQVIIVQRYIERNKE